MFRDSECPVHELQFSIEVTRDLLSYHTLKDRASLAAPVRHLEGTGQAGVQVVADVVGHLIFRHTLTVDVVIYCYMSSHSMLESYLLGALVAPSWSALGPGLPTSSGPIHCLRPDDHAR